MITRNQQASEQLRSQVFTLGAGAKLTATAAGAALGGLIAGHTSVTVLLAAAGASSLGAAALGRLALPKAKTSLDNSQPVTPAARPGAPGQA